MPGADARPTARGLAVAAVLVATVLALPMAGLVLGAFAPGVTGVWSHLVHSVLPRYVANSLVLAVSVGVGVAVLGAACAWLTAAFEFPGRRWLAWALVLPLAMPAYVVAYAYTDFLQFSGPVQTWVRELTGSKPAMQRSSVVLPQPLGPSRQAISPAASVKQSASHTRCSP